MLAPEEDANQPRSPSGMLTTQGQGLVPPGVVGRGAGAPAGVVGRCQGVGSVVVEALEQVADGPGRQAKVGGDGVGGLAALGAAPDDLAERGGGRRGHKESSHGVEEWGYRPQPIAPTPGGKTLCRI
jgi:hypothetical protein